MKIEEIKELETVFKKIYFNAKVDSLENDWLLNIENNIIALKNYHKIE